MTYSCKYKVAWNTPAFFCSENKQNAAIIIEFGSEGIGCKLKRLPKYFQLLKTLQPQINYSKTIPYPKRTQEAAARIFPNMHRLLGENLLI